MHRNKAVRESALFRDQLERTKLRLRKALVHFARLLYDMHMKRQSVSIGAGRKRAQPRARNSSHRMGRDAYPYVWIELAMYTQISDVAQDVVYICATEAALGGLQRQRCTGAMVGHPQERDAQARSLVRVDDHAA